MLKYDVIVIGGGHAGVEAAAASTPAKSVVFSLSPLVKSFKPHYIKSKVIIK